MSTNTPVLFQNKITYVTSAVDAGAKLIADKGLLVKKVVIPQPRPELLSEMI